LDDASVQAFRCNNQNIVEASSAIGARGSNLSPRKSDAIDYSKWLSWTALAATPALLRRKRMRLVSQTGHPLGMGAREPRTREADGYWLRITATGSDHGAICREVHDALTFRRQNLLTAVGVN
jgi:hypothetical protein